MNTFRFFNDNLGRFLSAQSEDPVESARRALSSAHLMASGKTSRLGSGWAIIREGEGMLQLKLAAKGPVYDDRTRYQAFLDFLLTKPTEPFMFLVFDKKPMPAENLFITADLRAVRVCMPKGVETFDWTREPDEDAGQYHRLLWKQNLKREKEINRHAA